MNYKFNIITDDVNSQYPDMIINCCFRNAVGSDDRDAVYQIVSDYISYWNSNMDNSSKIHYCELIDSPNENTVSVFVDFGNAEPIALMQLFDRFSASSLDIKEISL